MPSRRKKKSGLLITMGIVGIVFGCLGLLCGGCGLIGSAMAPSMAKVPGNPAAGMFAHLDREVPHWLAFDIAHQSLTLILSVFFVVAGIGLIMHKGWGRGLMIFSAAAFVLKQIGFGIYQFTTLMPAIERWQKTQPGGGGAGFGMGQQLGGGIATIVILVVPLILLITMILPAVGTALNPPKRRNVDLDDDLGEDTQDDDDNFDERPRRRDRDLPSDGDDQRFRARDE